jgi:hypothetical protein
MTAPSKPEKKAKILALKVYKRVAKKFISGTSLYSSF